VDQVPIHPSLEEGVDQFFITQLETLFRYYTNQQGEPQPIDLRSIYNKQDDIDYPFVGVLTNVTPIEPTAIGDLFEESTPTTDFYYTINDVNINLLLQAEEIRELQRLRSFIELNLQWGSNPVLNPPVRWAKIFQNAGIIFNGRFESTDYERVGFESIQQRTTNAQGRELMRRADIETLWEVEMKVNVLVQVGVSVGINDNARGIITGINFIINPRFN